MRRMEIITNHSLGKNTTLFFAEANEKWRIFELYQISHFSVKRDLGTRLIFTYTRLKQSRAQSFSGSLSAVGRRDKYPGDQPLTKSRRNSGLEIEVEEAPPTSSPGSSRHSKWRPDKTLANSALKRPLID